MQVQVFHRIAVWLLCYCRRWLLC